MTKQEIMAGIFKAEDRQELVKALDKICQAVDANEIDYDSFDECEMFMFIKKTWDTIENKVIH